MFCTIYSWSSDWAGNSVDWAINIGFSVLYDLLTAVNRQALSVVING